MRVSERVPVGELYLNDELVIVRQELLMIEALQFPVKKQIAAQLFLHLASDCPHFVLLQVHSQKGSLKELVEEGRNEGGRSIGGLYEKSVADLQVENLEAEFNEGHFEKMEGFPERELGTRKTELGEEAEELEVVSGKKSLSLRRGEMFLISLLFASRGMRRFRFSGWLLISSFFWF